MQHQQGEAGAQGLEEKLQTIQNMVDGLEKAYKSDNDMLESKVKRLTACMHEILQRHEQLLTAYKYDKDIKTTKTYCLCALLLGHS